jgi:hypothetical protein
MPRIDREKDRRALGDTPHPEERDIVANQSAMTGPNALPIRAVP